MGSYYLLGFCSLHLVFIFISSNANPIPARERENDILHEELESMKKSPDAISGFYQSCTEKRYGSKLMLRCFLCYCLDEGEVICRRKSLRLCTEADFQKFEAGLKQTGESEKSPSPHEAGDKNEDNIDAAGEFTKPPEDESDGLSTSQHILPTDLEGSKPNSSYETVCKNKKDGEHIPVKGICRFCFCRSGLPVCKRLPCPRQQHVDTRLPFAAWPLGFYNPMSSQYPSSPTVDYDQEYLPHFHEPYMSPIYLSPIGPTQSAALMQYSGTVHDQFPAATYENVQSDRFSSPSLTHGEVVSSDDNPFLHAGGQEPLPQNMHQQPQAPRDIYYRRPPSLRSYKLPTQHFQKPSTRHSPRPSAQRPSAQHFHEPPTHYSPRLPTQLFINL